MSYKAKIVTISKINSIPNKDRIVAAEIEEIPGLQVVVGKDVKPGDVMVYFPENTQLSEEFCIANDLYEKDLGNGKRSGYFDHKRRVKIIKLGGVRSEGFLVPTSHFDYLIFRTQTQVSSFKPGYEFDTIGSHQICKKYRIRFLHTPAKPKTKWEKVKQWFIGKKRAKNYYDAYDEFERHPDTEQFRDWIRRIPFGVILIITEKMHGQSARTGKLRELSWWKRLIERLLGEIFNAYQLMIGTRETVLNARGFHKAEFRKQLAQKFANCAEGEDFSYEIAGYDDSGNSLMKRQGLGKLKKEYDLAGFSDPMDYKYGCKPKECREFVYKLDIVTNGVRNIQSWDHTVNRCAELGLQTVPELDRFVHIDVEETLNRVNKWLANDKMKASTVDSSHLIEGVCIRVEELDNMGFVKQEWRAFKHKSFLFGVLEGYARENNEVEAEELESLENDKEEQ